VLILSTVLFRSESISADLLTRFKKRRVVGNSGDIFSSSNYVH
jgi:hypothetical protein